MKKAIMEKWVAALRSGEYEQGTDFLRQSNNKFCCLGVLCNLHAQAHPKIAAKETDPTKYLDCDEMLPREVQNWAGMDSYEGYFVDKWGNLRSLAHLNDNGSDFNKLANIIEKYYEQL